MRFFLIGWLFFILLAHCFSSSQGVQLAQEWAAKFRAFFPVFLTFSRSPPFKKRPAGRQGRQDDEKPPVSGLFWPFLAFYGSTARWFLVFELKARWRSSNSNKKVHCVVCFEKREIISPHSARSLKPVVSLLSAGRLGTLLV